MNESDLNRPNRWTWLSYAYAMLVVAGISYLLFDIPIQVSDSYGNLVAASGRTMGSLVYEQFHGRGFSAPSSGPTFVSSTICPAATITCGSAVGMWVRSCCLLSCSCGS